MVHCCLLCDHETPSALLNDWPAVEYINIVHSCQVLENVSSLCCAVRMRSSIFRISSTFPSHISMVGGRADFQQSGMQALGDVSLTSCKFCRECL